MIYAGVILSYFTYSLITDNMGRKYSLTISYATFLFGMLLLASSWDIWVIALAIFLIGLGIAQVQSIGFMIYN
jgi:predicted MFS family arabinose efflux permease